MNKKVLLLSIFILLFGFFTPTVHAASIDSFTAFPIQVMSGDPSTITWESTGYWDGCFRRGASWNGWNADGGGQQDGSQTINPTSTRSYAIECRADADVGVGNPLLISISANPQPAILWNNSSVVITAGQPVTLTWTTRYATSCTGTGQGFTGVQPLQGPLAVYPSADTAYRINCTGPGGLLSSPLKQVTVTPNATLTANPTTIVSGNSAVLSWSSLGATTCSSAEFATGGATSGSLNVSPATTSLYRITCTAASGATVNRSVNVTVTPAPTLNIGCSVNPTAVATGVNVTWSATASGGTPPYTIDWSGDNLLGTGFSRIISYATAGIKAGAIRVTDSSVNLGPPYTKVQTEDSICTGPSTGYDYWWSTEDGETEPNIENMIRLVADGAIHDSTWGPSAYYTNPESYCLQERITQDCNPSLHSFAAGTCPFSVRVELHSGSGRRATVGSDYPTSNPQVDNYATWVANRYFGTLTYTPSVPVNEPEVEVGSCSNTVTASAGLPTASLSAFPVSISAGSTTSLTWSSTNATSCLGTNFSTGAGSISGTVTDSPATTTPYAVVCNGPGGTATSTISVDVTQSALCPLPIEYSSEPLESPNAFERCISSGYSNIVSTWVEDSDYRGKCLSDTMPGQCCGVRVNSPTFSNVRIFSNGNSCGVPNPDVSAGSFTPTTASVGSPITLRATISNIGLAATAPFSSVFYICREGDAACQSEAIGKAPSIWTRILAYISSKVQAATVEKVTTNSVSLAASVSGTQTAPHTFTGSPGNYVIKFCANNNGGGGNFFTELNFGNNCGAWTVVVVSPASGTVSCTVNTTNPAFGFPAIYTATPSGGASAPYAWDDFVGNNYGTGATAMRNFPPEGGTFAMRVTGTNAARVDCPMVTYAAVCPTTSTASISAFPARVNIGDTSSIAWTIGRAAGSSCVVSGPGISYTSPTIPICIGPILIDENFGQTTPPITTQSVYTVRCNGVKVAETIVNIVPSFEEF